MHSRTLSISPEWLLQLLQLPAGTRFESAAVDPVMGNLEVQVSHPSFPPSPTGQVQRVRPLYHTVSQQQFAGWEVES